MHLNDMVIEEYSYRYSGQIVDLILDIQQKEFHVSITAADQPDLGSIKEFYQKGNGNFWIAIDKGHVVGTIGLIDIGHCGVALRKMFVHREYRGKEKATAQKLMDRVLAWCDDHELKEIYLGTINTMKAAHRFYEKNQFGLVNKNELPTYFPIMPVDNVFYKYSFAAR